MAKYNALLTSVVETTPNDKVQLDNFSSDVQFASKKKQKQPTPSETKKVEPKSNDEDYNKDFHRKSTFVPMMMHM
jgi:hypothetical protein